MNEAQKVYEAAEVFIGNHDYKLKNVFVHRWEADLFSVTSSKYAYEIEVKISRSDFFADFKKPKHHLFKSHKKGFGILRGDQSFIINRDLRYCEHPDLLNFEIKWTHIEALKICGSTVPNKFYYACPIDLIKPEEVPEYAGLIYAPTQFGSYKVIKKAPFLHKEEFPVKTMLFTKYFYLCQEQKKQIWDLEREIERLKNDPI